MEAKKILFVEDDLATRELYQEVLEEAGFSVDVARDGKERLTKAQVGGYALIVLDIMLPKMDGLALMGELKLHPAKLSNGGIVLLTNLEHDSIVREGLKMGALDCIVKSSINPGQFVEKVKGYLGM